MADMWVVTSQRQTTDLDPSGRFADVMEITFRTQAGTTGSIRVPLDRYTPENVRSIIDDYVERISGVESL